MKSYIFLDIDGVLNGHKNYQEHDEAEAEANGYSIPDDHVRHLQVNQEVDLLARIAGAEVVVSSTWRLLYRNHWQDLIDLLRRRGLTATIAGATPNLSISTHMAERGDEITAWLMKHAGEKARIVVLDDDSDMTAVKWWHVRTETSVGLGLNHALEAAKILLDGPVWERARVVPPRESFGYNMGQG